MPSASSSSFSACPIAPGPAGMILGLRSARAALRRAVVRSVSRNRGCPGRILDKRFRVGHVPQVMMWPKSPPATGGEHSYVRPRHTARFRDAWRRCRRLRRVSRAMRFCRCPAPLGALDRSVILSMAIRSEDGWCSASASRGAAGIALRCPDQHAHRHFALVAMSRGGLLRAGRLGLSAAAPVPTPVRR